MADVDYRLATVKDLESLVTLRCAFLTEASGNQEASGLRGTIKEYFDRLMPRGEFVSFVAVAKEAKGGVQAGEIVATSGMVFHLHPPEPENVSGKEAYVMNMYTRPAWRGRGIAAELVKLLKNYAKEKGCGRITLHTMPLARELYARAGFKPAEEMRCELNERPEIAWAPVEEVAPAAGHWVAMWE
jgi:GNAT superfamily N-acetyltransferase